MGLYVSLPAPEMPAHQLSWGVQIVGVSLSPRTFHDPDSDTISGAQAAMLKAKGIKAGISSGLDEHLVESWLFDEFAINVDDVEDLTVGQLKFVLEEMGWES